MHQIDQIICIGEYPGKATVTEQAPPPPPRRSPAPIPRLNPPTQDGHRIRLEWHETISQNKKKLYQKYYIWIINSKTDVGLEVDKSSLFSYLNATAVKTFSFQTKSERQNESAQMRRLI